MGGSCADCAVLVFFLEELVAFLGTGVLFFEGGGGGSTCGCGTCGCPWDKKMSMPVSERVCLSVGELNYSIGHVYTDLEVSEHRDASVSNAAMHPGESGSPVCSDLTKYLCSALVGKGRRG